MEQTKCDCCERVGCWMRDKDEYGNIWSCKCGNTEPRYNEE